MRFAFSDEQLLLRDSVRDVLAKECTPAIVRAAWMGEIGRSPRLWTTLADTGVVGLTAPERFGGLGLSELDLVLVLEETGRAALPEPLLETTAVGVPLLGDLGDAALAEAWIPRVTDGSAILTVGLSGARHVADAHVADLLLLQRDDAWHAVPRAQAKLTLQPTVDGAQRWFTVEWDAAAGTRVAHGPNARRAAAAAFDRGAFAASAQLVGLAARMLDMTVEYVKTRQQFGVPIGSFQAVKHHLTNALVGLEFARPVVYRAADSLARGVPAEERAVHVSMAKSYATEAALGAAKAALQCHGAIGYSFEYDLHLWMKRAWALAAAWGDAAWHRARVAAAILPPVENAHG
jgi:alkylation response protein AidB-like acyl-CoA dehydrogenase